MTILTHRKSRIGSGSAVPVSRFVIAAAAYRSNELAADRSGIMAIPGG